MIEIEAKIPIEKQELERLVEELESSTPQNQANVTWDSERNLPLPRPKGFFDQENIIYDFGETALRIRKEIGKTIVTYKGPLQENKFKSREEIEFRVNTDSETVAKIFSNLGFQETLRYTKQRANYQLNNCTISLDILENNSHYIEIEGAEADIERTIQTLGLTDKPIEKRNYQEILQGVKWHA